MRIFLLPCLLHLGRALVPFAALVPLAAGAARAEEAPAGLGVTMTEMLQGSKSGFFLLRFNGMGVDEEPLAILSREGARLVVGLPDRDAPRFVVRVEENPDYLAFHLDEKRGDFSGREVSLLFRSQHARNLEAIALDYMGRIRSRGSLSLVWPYLWNSNPSDPLGAFAVFREGSASERDESLAAVWAEGTLPHPDLGVPWTKARVREWIDAYCEKFDGLSETVLSAGTGAELRQLTEWLHRAGVRRVYLHTDTWRGEYWPARRSFVAVKPEVFPGGDADLKRYRDELGGKGMLLRLHNVSGGIGSRDPEFFTRERVDPRLSTWVKGRLEAPVAAAGGDWLFRPEPGSELPHLRMGRYWNLNFFRIGAELVRVAELQDVDGPVWRLKGVMRGRGSTRASGHQAGEEVAGLMSAYGQNFVPDSHSDLFGEMASRYANFINAMELDHQHYDGAEIHIDTTPWGFDKFSFLVTRGLRRSVTSSTSGGTSVPWNFEHRFSRVKAIRELTTRGVFIPVLLDGHRNASSWLDANYELAIGFAKNGGGRLGFSKPEPMFGISPEIFAGHGLMPRYERLFRDWHDAAGSIGEKEIDFLRATLTPARSSPSQAGLHLQPSEIPVLTRQAGGFAFVPTCVMVREGLDAPWISGQEFGPLGPRQYLQPGDKVRLTNPYAAQAPELILRVLPALGVAAAQATAAAPAVRHADDMLESYRTGTEKTPREPGDPGPARPSPAASPAPSLMPANAQALSWGGDTTMVWRQGQLDLRLDNASSKPVSEESDLPSWKCNVPMAGRRGLAFDVVGDGSGAVLLAVLQAGGRRDYAIRIDFTGPRRVVIPNGEASWAEGCWGWRFPAKQFDYQASISRMSLGFGSASCATRSSASAAARCNSRERSWRANT
jgi:hypothetical protein